MKKCFAAMALAVLAIFVLTGCAEQDEALLGTWRWSTDGTYSYVFNDDGTGERGYPWAREVFTWTTNGTRLNINRNRPYRGEIRNESWDFEIINDVLTIENRRVANVIHSYVFDAGEYYSALAGVWYWEGTTYTYVFNADGTGTRGLPGESHTFTWTATETRLHIQRDHAPESEIRGEIWSFEIDDGTLTITSFQEDDFIMRLRPVSFD